MTGVARRPRTIAPRPARLTLITLAVILAAYEAALDRHSWRHDGGCAEKHYLQFLDELGYQLCDVERLAAGLEPRDNEE
jgi:hypothetical protein